MNNILTTFIINISFFTFTCLHANNIENITAYLLTTLLGTIESDSIHPFFLRIISYFFFVRYYYCHRVTVVSYSAENISLTLLASVLHSTKKK